jgi:hypothetical protein
VWPIVLAFGSLAFFLALTGKAKAESGGPKELTPSPVPPALPPAVVPGKAPPKKLIVTKTLPPAAVAPKAPPGLPEGCKEEDRTFIANVIQAMGKGTASLDMMRKAHAIALKCFPATAGVLKEQLDRALLAARAKAIPDPQAALNAMMLAPDAPPSPIPNDPKSGKALWRMIRPKRGKFKNQFIAKPNFGPVKALFQKMQALLKAQKDGDIGPETVVKFRNLMAAKGHAGFPTTAAQLAANIVKYITVLEQDVPASRVGASGGSTLPTPFLGG